MTGPREPKVANIPTSLEVYPDITLSIRDLPPVLARRDEHGVWSVQTPLGPVWIGDWLDHSA